MTRAFRFDDPEDVARVREVLDRAGFRDEGVWEILGVEALTELDVARLPLLLQRTAGGETLESLVRLFVVGLTVDAETAQRAVAPMTPQRWVELGLLEPNGDGYRATVQLRCRQGLVVAFDFARRTDGGLRADYVMGISASTLSLAGLTIRRPVGDVLDLGTGSGFHALLATEHARRVVATDLNPRAVELTAFTAHLNQREIEVLGGDMFEPVAGRTFDQIISNPPFIIAPEATHLFIHGAGFDGDEVCRRVAREAPAYLNEGGLCQFLANWAIVRGEDWTERLAGWFEGSGCDAWVLRRGVIAPGDYAAMWIETGADGRGFDETFADWMRFYEERGIEAIGSGLITMRRHVGANWYRTDDAPDRIGDRAGEDVLRCIEHEDFLRAHPGAALAGARLAISPDVRLRQDHELVAGGWQAMVGMLRRIEGLQYEVSIDPFGAALVAACDGTRPVGEVIRGLARSSGEDPPEGTLDTVRSLVRQGFLRPAGG